MSTEVDLQGQPHDGGGSGRIEQGAATTITSTTNNTDVTMKGHSESAYTDQSQPPLASTNNDFANVNSSTGLNAQGKGSDQVYSGLDENEDLDGSETQDLPNDPNEDSNEKRLNIIAEQQALYSTQYAYLAHCLTRALDARIARTLELMDEAATTGRQPEALDKIYSTLFDSLQSKHKGPHVVVSEHNYEINKIHSLARSNVGVVWEDFHKQKNDLQIAMCDQVAAEMVSLFKEKRKCTSGGLRAMDWISNNLDVVHDLGSRPKITCLTVAEIKGDLEKVKQKPIRVKEEINLAEFDGVDEDADILRQLADLVDQQASHQAVQPQPVSQQPLSHAVTGEQHTQPSPALHTQQQAQHQQPPQHTGYQHQHSPLQQPQPQLAFQPLAHSQQPQHPPFPSAHTDASHIPGQRVPAIQGDPQNDYTQETEREQVPIESHTTTRSRSRSHSKATRHHSVSPAPKRHKHTSSFSQQNIMHPPHQQQESPYQVHVQPQVHLHSQVHLPLPQRQQQQQHQQQHQLPPPGLQNQQPVYGSMMSPQQAYQMSPAQQPQQQPVKMYQMQYDAGHQQAQQSQRPPFIMPPAQQQPMYLPGYDQQHGGFPPSQWAPPKAQFPQGSPPHFQQPMPGIMPPGQYYYPEQHAPHPQQQHHQQYYQGYDERYQNHPYNGAH